MKEIFCKISTIKYPSVGSNDNRTYVFERSSGTPLWNYTAGGILYAVAMSANGAYITVGGDDHHIYLLFQDLSTVPPAGISFGYWFILFALPALVAVIIIRRKSFKNV